MKSELIEKLARNRDELLNLVAGLSEEQLTTFAVVGEWTIKDAVGHIAYWEGAILDMVNESYTEGRPRPMLADVNDDGINAREAAKRKNWSWAQVRAEFENIRAALIGKVEALSETDLALQVPSPWWNDKRVYPVGQMIEEDAIGHCREHLDQIERWQKGRRT